MQPARHPIDLATYARADILRAFIDRQMPQFSTTCEVDVSGIRAAANAEQGSFFVAMSYAVSRAVNAVPALRHRLVDGVLYEYERVDPGYTVARDDDLFSFCDSIYFEDYRRYAEHCAARIDTVKLKPNLETGEKHHMFFITSIPWFAFTAFTQPYDPAYAYIPVITLGKCVEQAGGARMPIAVQVHHGLVDGVHVARFYAALQALSESAATWFR